MAVQNYKHTSVEQKKELSDLLYNNKKPKTCTIGSGELENHPNPGPQVSVTPEIQCASVLSTAMPVQQPQLEINMPKITVNPVKNFIVQNNNILIPPIDMQLTINIS